MEPVEFRKLRVWLPRQPLVDQRPWWITGLALTFIILVFVAWSYYSYSKHKASSDAHNKINYESER